VQEAGTALDIDPLFAAWDRDETPGCAVGLVRGGEPLLVRCYGMADLEHGVQITPDTVFDIGSTSKQFTAACILLLAREGRLSLDDDVRKYVSRLPDFGPTITVRHLVHHTSGLRDYLALTVLAGRRLENDYSEEEVVDLLSRQRRLDFRPGTRFGYSNSGYFLLGEIVRTVAGSSLRSFSEERIFGPLGMTHTRFRDDFKELIPGRAASYSPAADGRGFHDALSLWDVVGDGAVFTTVGDLAIWDRQFYDCDLPGGADFVAQLCEPGRLASGKPLDYAFGLMLSSHRGCRTVQHGGSWAGFRAQVMRFPDQHVTAIVLANVVTLDPSARATELAELALGDALEPIAIGTGTQPGEAPAPLVPGAYCDRAATRIIEVVEADGAANACLGGQVFPLAPAGGGRYRVGEVGIELEVAGPDAVRLRSAALNELHRRTTGDRPSGDALGAYEGAYRSPELDVTYTVYRDGGALHARPGYGQPLELRPAGGDLFDAGFPVLRFRRREGRVVGFVLGAGRAASIRFSRVTRGRQPVTPPFLSRNRAV